MTNGVKQVGFAQADRAVNEKRIIGASRRVSHSGGGGVGKLTIHPSYKGFEGVTADQLSRERLGLFFSFCLQEMVFGGGSGPILGPHHIKTDFYLTANGQGGALAELIEVVFFDPVLVDGVFHSENQAAGLIAQGDNGGEPAVKSVRGDYFFKFATDFDPDFRRIVHSFLFSFLVSGMNHSRQKIMVQAEFYFLSKIYLNNFA